MSGTRHGADGGHDPLRTFVEDRHTAGMGNVDCTTKAERLFRELANRHNLRFEPDADAPVEVCWRFPVQPGLSTPITLALQNLDELNFGVGEFWSYFFPFDDIATKFEGFIDAWIDGDARVVMTGRSSGWLQIRDGATWKIVYSANPSLFRRRPKGFLMNEDARPRSRVG